MRSKTDRVMCGTCQYWTGQREPVFDKNGNPKVDIFDEYGACEHPHVPIEAKRRRDLRCVRHSKWTEIL